MVDLVAEARTAGRLDLTTGVAMIGPERGLGGSVSYERMGGGVMGPNTIIENMVTGALKWWEVGGYSCPKAYLAGAFTLGYLTWAEYEQAVRLLEERSGTVAA